MHGISCQDRRKSPCELEEVSYNLLEFLNSTKLKWAKQTPGTKLKGHENKLSLHCIGSLTSRRFLATNRDRKWKSAAVSWNRKAILWDKSGKIPWKPMWKRWVHHRGEEGQAAEGKRWPVWLAWEGAGAGYPRAGPSQTVGAWPEPGQGLPVSWELTAFKGARHVLRAHN